MFACRYTLQVRAKLFSSVGPDATFQWTYRRCASTEYAIITGNDTVTCEPCPDGGDCTVAAAVRGHPGDPAMVSSGNTSVLEEGGLFNVVQQQHIMAQAGFWASQTANGLKYVARGSRVVACVCVCWGGGWGSVSTPASILLHMVVPHRPARGWR
jgi:hypothetical protein